MTFVVMLVTLLIERFFDWSHLRQWGWYTNLENAAAKRFAGTSPYLVLAASIIPLMFALYVLKIIFQSMLFGFPWVLAQFVVVLYCFGPKNLWADAFASINSLSANNTAVVNESMQSHFGYHVSSNAEPIHQQLISQIIIAANQRVFGVIFWYAILGLPGAVMYRAVSLSANVQDAPEVSATARTVQDALDWLPVRVLTFFFALGGNFNRVFSCWRQRVMLGLDGNQILMTECGLAAITNGDEKVPEDGSLERNAVSMLDRVFIISLIASLVLILAKII